MQSLLAYTPGIRAGLIIGGSKAELLKISRKADRDAPCDQARMLDSVRTEVLHDAKPANERKLALGLCPKPHLFFSKRFFYSLSRCATHSGFSQKKLDALHVYEKIIMSTDDAELIRSAQEEMCNAAINLVWSYKKSKYDDQVVWNKLRKYIQEQEV